MLVKINEQEVEIKEPTPTTLKKYGLSLSEWQEIVTRQGYKCPVCENYLLKRTNIDHYHVKNWKNFPPNLRKMFVRGITCWWCNNSYLGRGITVEKAQNMVKYLQAFEERKQK